MLRLLLCLLLAPLASAQNADPSPSPPSVKGLQVQMIDDALELGIHHAGVSVNITALYAAGSAAVTGKMIVRD